MGGEHYDDLHTEIPWLLTFQEFAEFYSQLDVSPAVIARLRGLDPVAEHETATTKEARNHDREQVITFVLRPSTLGRYQGGTRRQLRVALTGLLAVLQHENPIDAYEEFHLRIDQGMVVWHNNHNVVGLQEMPEPEQTEEQMQRRQKVSSISPAILAVALDMSSNSG